MNPRIESLEKMLGGPRDGALLRFSLGNEYLKAGDPAKAGKCFQEAVDRDSRYSAAWKALGKALAEAGDASGALAAYERGIALYRQCQTALEQAEQRVTLVNNAADPESQTPFRERDDD